MAEVDDAYLLAQRAAGLTTDRLPRFLHEDFAMTPREVAVATGRVRAHHHRQPVARALAELGWLWRAPSKERVEDLGALVIFLILRTPRPERFSAILRGHDRDGRSGYELLGDGAFPVVLRLANTFVDECGGEAISDADMRRMLGDWQARRSEPKG